MQEQSGTRRRLNDAHMAVWVVKRLQERERGEREVKRSELSMYVSFFFLNSCSDSGLGYISESLFVYSSLCVC